MATRLALVLPAGSCDDLGFMRSHFPLAGQGRRYRVLNRLLTIGGIATTEVVSRPRDRNKALHLQSQSGCSADLSIIVVLHSLVGHPMSNLTYPQFNDWLTSYGSAWEAKDTDDFAALFSHQARYYWTPFDEPRRGRAEIATAFLKATSAQRGIHFVFDILHIDGHRGAAHWKCSFERIATDTSVQVDGILMTQMDGVGLCDELREWWSMCDKSAS